MKIIRLIFIACALAVAVPVSFTGCSTSQTEATYRTLDAVGKTAKASLDASTALLKQGAITVVQWQKIANAYDNDFQPAYALAVAAAGSASAPAPDALVEKQAALSAAVSQLKSSNRP